MAQVVERILGKDEVGSSSLPSSSIQGNENSPVIFLFRDDKMEIIARIYNDYKEKFGVPRQSGIVEEKSVIVFEPKYRIAEALRGIEEYNYLWLIWEFSECKDKEWSPTVRPPRLGGNVRKGVFATRSPFRPNSMGLSSVKLIGKESTVENGTILIVSGADIMNGTPIYDIKPYLNYVDCHTDANNGFALSDKSPVLNVIIPDEIKKEIPAEKAEIISAVLAQDPRPQYIDDPEREYGISISDMNIKFRINGTNLTVTSAEKI